MFIKQYVSGPLAVNCYLVADEQSKKGFIIDPGGESRKLLIDVEENNIKVEYIILTHGHPDHICGIEFFQKAFPKALVVAHKEDDFLLVNPKKNNTRMFCGRDIVVKTDRYVDDLDTLSIGNMELTFYHTPGHTPGGICIYIEGHLFSGDTLFYSSIGRTDFPYSSYQAIKDAIRNKLFTLPEQTIVYPGHDRYSDIGFEKENNPFV